MCKTVYVRYLYWNDWFGKEVNKMDDEKKTYSFIGTVTIGTDEYRDLITEKFEAIRQYNEESNRWYKEYSRANKLESENKKLKEELDQLKAYIKDNNEQDKYELWIVRAKLGE